MFIHVLLVGDWLPFFCDSHYDLISPHHSFPLFRLLEIKSADFFPISRWTASVGCEPSTVPSTVNPSTRSQSRILILSSHLACRRVIREGKPRFNFRYSVSLSGNGGWPKNCFRMAVEEWLIHNLPPARHIEVILQTFWQVLLWILPLQWKSAQPESHNIDHWCLEVGEGVSWVSRYVSRKVDKGT